MQYEPNSFTAQPRSNKGLLKRPVGWFYGDRGLTSLGRLAVFLAIVATLLSAKEYLLHHFIHGDKDAIYLLDKISKLAIFVFASWVMTKIERATFGDYGLPWRKAFKMQFWQGAAAAFVCLSAYVVILCTFSSSTFEGFGLSGLAVPIRGLIYALIFTLIAVEEEFQFRGYALYGSSKVMGFWPAAIVTSIAFALVHTSNSGETVTGVMNAGVAGLFFCLLLKVSGNLWLPIGFHVAWDWGQTYFYGLPDSGHVLPGHLTNVTVAANPTWLTGGTVGPEGSIAFTLLLAVFSLLVMTSYRPRRNPT